MKKKNYKKKNSEVDASGYLEQGYATTKRGQDDNRYLYYSNAIWGEIDVYIVHSYLILGRQYSEIAKDLYLPTEVVKRRYNAKIDELRYSVDGGGYDM